MLRFRPSGRARAAPATLFALGAALACAPAVAHAQAPAHGPNDEQDRAARAEFLAGREAFTRGSYDDAARRFEHAYQLSGRAQLLYNIGTAYDRLHLWHQARDAWHRYLDAVPNAVEGDEVRARLVVIEQTIAREQLAGDRVAAAANARPTERIIVRTAPTDPHTWRTLALALAVPAVFAGAISGGVALFTNPYYDMLVTSCGVGGAAGTGCPQPDITDIQLRATLINVFLIGSLVLATGAGASLAMELTQPHPPPAPASAACTLPRWSASIAPLAGGGGAVFVSGAL